MRERREADGEGEPKASTAKPQKNARRASKKAR
jgi:hypothetical protein